jgi:hypothetical protein
LGATQLKRISSYWFQMGSIGADALMEQMFPFGAPRWLGYDYTGFAPQLGIQSALLTTAEKMGGQAIQNYFNQQKAGNLPPMPGGSGAGGPSTPGQVGASAGNPIAGQPGQDPPAVGSAAGAQIGPDPAAPPPPPNDPFHTNGNSPGTTTNASAPEQWRDYLTSPTPGTYAKGGTVGLYDNGGMLEPGQFAFNGTHEPEPIFTQSQLRDMKANMASNGGGGGYNDFRFMPQQVVVKDVKELERQVADRRQLESMRYRGRPSQG